MLSVEKTLYFRGQPIDCSPQAFGLLRPSDEVLSDPSELRQRFAEDGYLYIPKLLNRDDLLAARQTILERLADLGYLDPDYSVSAGVAKPEFNKTFMPELAQDNQALMKVLYSGPMITFYEHFLGGPILHFDYTWFRAKTAGPETATQPHYDIVYMGRGTKKLCTSWTPLGDVPMTMGGLMILENSHRLDQVKATYGQIDVDEYCTNYADAEEIESGQKQWQRSDGGAYSTDAIATRQTLGGRWLTTDYQLGDVLIFGMYTMHASLDNQTNQFRLSSDSRYQLASEPADERWIGASPIGHGLASKRGMIC